jgi:hypothetical protein
MARAAGLAAAAFWIGVLAGGTAHANGAFPNGQTILVPADRPDETVIATNFGLVMTDDGGRSWLYSCEQTVNSFARLYQMAPATHRLFAIAGTKLIYTDDESCGWQTAGGSLATTSAQDAFVDPSDGNHLLAVTATFGGGPPAYAVVESHDGGATFGAPIYSGAPGDLITGVEIAASDPTTIDLAVAQGSSLTPALVQTRDSGKSWQTFDLSAIVGSTAQVRIVAIVPDDPDHVHLRALETGGDALVLVGSDGTLRAPALMFPNGQLLAFTRTSAGSILAAGLTASTPVLYRSTDGGDSFTPVQGAPSVLTLAARGGLVYAATDSSVEPYAVATSADDGLTWTPGLEFSEINAILPCVASACQTDCRMRASQGQWPAAMCAAAAPVDAAAVLGATDPSDAGVPPVLVDAAASIDATSPGRAGLDASRVVDAGDVRLPHGSGCSCAVPDGPGGGVGCLLIALVALLSRGARRSVRATRPSSRACRRGSRPRSASVPAAAPPARPPSASCSASAAPTRRPAPARWARGTRSSTTPRPRPRPASGTGGAAARRGGRRSSGRPAPASTPPAPRPRRR